MIQPIIPRDSLKNFNISPDKPIPRLQDHLTFENPVLKFS